MFERLIGAIRGKQRSYEKMSTYAVATELQKTQQMCDDYREAAEKANAKVENLTKRLEKEQQISRVLTNEKNLYAERVRQLEEELSQLKAATPVVATPEPEPAPVRLRPGNTAKTSSIARIEIYDPDSAPILGEPATEPTPKLSQEERLAEYYSAKDRIARGEFVRFTCGTDGKMRLAEEAQDLESPECIAIREVSREIRSEPEVGLVVPDL